jgi:hypothetical protein
MVALMAGWRAAQTVALSAVQKALLKVALKAEYLDTCSVASWVHWRVVNWVEYLADLMAVTSEPE